MALIEIKQPSKGQLAWFGLLMGIFFGVFGLILRWRFASSTPLKVCGALAVALPLVYYAIPPIRKPIYLGWMYAAFPIGWTVSHVILLLTYYVVVTPLGIMLRLVSYDPMNRRIEPDAASYWIPRGEAVPSSRYFRQF